MPSSALSPSASKSSSRAKKDSAKSSSSTTQSSPKSNSKSKDKPETQEGDSPIRYLLFVLSVVAVHIAVLYNFKQKGGSLDLGIMPSLPPHVDALIKELDTDKTKLLDVSFGEDCEITSPGIKLPRAKTHTLPTLHKLNLPADPSQRYMALCLDPDAPLPILPLAAPIIHWLQTDLSASSAGELTSTSAPIAPYRGPGPPPGSPPHRYIFLLYKQPKGLDVSTLRYFEGEGEAKKEREITMWERIRTDVAKWEGTAGVGKSEVVGVNMFTANT